MGDHLEKRETIVKILEKLHFDQFLKKYSPRTSVTSDSLNKLSPLQFRLICYFLFYKLDVEKCRKRFKNVFPSRDVRQEAEFRRMAIEYLNDLAEDKIHSAINIARIAPIHYQRLSGQVFIEQMLNFCIYVSHKTTSKHRTLLDKFESIEQAEQYIQQKRTKNTKMAQELSYYGQSVKDKKKHFQQTISTIHGEIDKLESHGTISKIEQQNQRLSNEIVSMDGQLSRILSIWHNNKSIDDNVHFTNHLREFCSKIEQLLLQFEHFTNSFNSLPDCLIEAIKQLREFHQTLQQIQDQIDSCHSKMVHLEQRLISLKEEVLNHPYTNRCREEIKDYLKPLLNIQLKLNHISYEERNRVNSSSENGISLD